MEPETDSGWDGGWENAADEGEGLAELMLGPNHPYDRADGYTPASRWGTGHDLGLRQDSDQVAASDEGNFAVRRPGPNAPRRSKKPGSTQTRSAERDLQTALALGTTVGRVANIRHRHDVATKRFAHLPKNERTRTVAAWTGLTPEQLKRFRAAESQPVRTGSVARPAIVSRKAALPLAADKDEPTDTAPSPPRNRTGSSEAEPTDISDSHSVVVRRTAHHLLIPESSVNLIIEHLPILTEDNRRRGYPESIARERAMRDIGFSPQKTEEIERTYISIKVSSERPAFKRARATSTAGNSTKPRRRKSRPKARSGTSRSWNSGREVKNQIRQCGACGRPISVNGFCGCS